MFNNRFCPGPSLPLLLSISCSETSKDFTVSPAGVQGLPQLTFLPLLAVSQLGSFILVLVLPFVSLSGNTFSVIIFSAPSQLASDSPHFSVQSSSSHLAFITYCCLLTWVRLSLPQDWKPVHTLCGLPHLDQGFLHCKYPETKHKIFVD